MIKTITVELGENEELAVVEKESELPEINDNKYFFDWYPKWAKWLNYFWRQGQLNYKLRLNSLLRNGRLAVNLTMLLTGSDIIKHRVIGENS